MFVAGVDTQHFVTYAGRVVAPAAMDAYNYLVGWGATSSTFTCAPGVHGRITDVRYKFGDAQYFAFIPNQRWLLFYFRKPCLQFPKYARGRLAKCFPALKATRGGEFTLRLVSLEDAVRVVHYIEN